MIGEQNLRLCVNMTSHYKCNETLVMRSSGVQLTSP